MNSIFTRWTGSVSTPANTNENTLTTVVIPTGLVTPISGLQFAVIGEVNNNANQKTVRLKLNGTLLSSLVWTTAVSFVFKTALWFNNSLTSQIAQGTGLTGFGSSSSSTLNLSLDFTSPVTFTITGQKANGSDTLNILGYEISVITPDELLLGKIGAAVDDQPTFTKYTFTDGLTTRKDWK